MKINDDGISLIKHFEGCKLETYLDAVGIPTIGYGHVGPEAKLGHKITQEEADNLLIADLQKFEDGVTALRCDGLNPNQFSALVCFAFNVGLHNLATSSLLKYAHSNDFDKAGREFLKWNHAGGQVLAGLTKRRMAEKQLFNKDYIVC